MKTLTADERGTIDAIGMATGCFETMKTRNHDGSDFREVHVEAFRKALEQAYRAGRDYEAEQRIRRTK